SFEADPAKVSSVAGAFQAWKAASFADSTDPKVTGLAKPTGKVSVRTKDKKVLTVMIGALKGDNYYLQVTGRPDIYMVPKYSAERILKKSDDLKKGEAKKS